MNKFLFLILCISFFFRVNAQLPVAVPVTKDTTSKLRILEGSGRYSFEKIDSLTTVITLAARARLQQDKTLIEADSARINNTTKVMEAFGNVHINDADTTNTYSQYIKYFSQDKKALLKNNVKLVNNKGATLTTDELDYDLNTEVATYSKGGKIINNKTVLTSKEGTYFGQTKDVIFRKDVVLIDPEYRLVADSLLYNTETEIARFIAPTTIISGKRKIYTSDGFYNLKTGEAYFGKRATMMDSTQTITADETAYDDKNGFAQYRGNVIYRDTAAGQTLLAGKLDVNKNKSSFLATEHPVMILKQDKDSLFITGDTLFSGRLTDRGTFKEIPIITDTIKNPRVFDLNGKDSAQNRFFEAFHNVRIFSDSMQAVCDSMFYSSVDSAFRLYTNPIIWANNSQITGDTIFLFTKNKKADRMYAYENGFIINKVATYFYNQVKGRTVNGFFKDGNIDYVRTKGNAESIYYVQDETDRFVKVNKATADAIDMFFKNKKADKVKFIKDLKGVANSTYKINPEEYKLKNFKWQDDKRPKTKYELFGN